MTNKSKKAPAKPVATPAPIEAETLTAPVVTDAAAEVAQDVPSDTKPASEQVALGQAADIPAAVPAADAPVSDNDAQNGGDDADDTPADVANADGDVAQASTDAPDVANDAAAQEQPSVPTEEAPERWLELKTSMAGVRIAYARGDKAPFCDKPGPNGEPSEAQRLIDAGFAIPTTPDA